MVSQSATSGFSRLVCYVIVEPVCMPGVSAFFKDTVKKKKKAALIVLSYLRAFSCR